MTAVMTRHAPLGGNADVPGCSRLPSGDGPVRRCNPVARRQVAELHAVRLVKNPSGATKRASGRA
jgi:hypothetical protein